MKKLLSDQEIELAVFEFLRIYRQSPIFSLVTNTQLSSLNANITRIMLTIKHKSYLLCGLLAAF